MTALSITINFSQLLSDTGFLKQGASLFFIVSHSIKHCFCLLVLWEWVFKKYSKCLHLHIQYTSRSIITVTRIFTLRGFNPLPVPPHSVTDEWAGCDLRTRALPATSHWISSAQWPWYPASELVKNEDWQKCNEVFGNIKCHSHWHWIAVR